MVKTLCSNYVLGFVTLNLEKFLDMWTKTVKTSEQLLE